MAAAASDVQLTVNGILFKVPVAEAAGKTLNEFIRLETGFTGTKVSCAQGGCGACTVAVARPGQGLKSTASCLMPLASAHGAAILTAEGLAKQDVEGKVLPHPVQERLAKFNGSQCGFCTPGMVMQIFSTLSEQAGGAAAKEKDMEQCINGNICRCTGYRPIVECAKSFASDTTVKNDFDAKCEMGPYDVAKDPDLIYPPAEAVLSEGRWFRPGTLKDVLSAMGKGATPIAGGTAHGVYPELGVVGATATFVDLKGIADPDFTTVQSDGSMIRVGAGVTWSRFVEELGKCGDQQPLQELAARCGSIAGAQVRNNATLGGNIAITRNKGFLSDWVPLLAALGSKVKTISYDGNASEIDLLAFVHEEVPYDGLIHSVSFPVPAEGLCFKAYRVAKRSRNAHALVNAGFAAKVAGGEVKEVSVVVGAVDPKPVRMRHLEAGLKGVTAAALQRDASSVVAAATETMRSGDLFQMACEFGREQTDHIISGFVLKFIVELFPDAVPKDWRSASYCLHDMERKTAATQTFPQPADLGGDLHKIMTKTTALEQTMGEAKFTDDVPRPERTLIAAFVSCPEANASFSEISTAAAQEMLGSDFHSIITSEDLKANMLNVNALLGFDGKPPDYKEDFQCEDEFLLPKDTPSKYAHQPVGLLLAHGPPKLVELAAAKVSESLRVTVHDSGVKIGNMEEGEELTTEPLVMTKGKKRVEPILEAAKRGQGSQYVTGKFEMKSQQHFYMENQSIVVLPDESGLIVYAACQGPDLLQQAIAKVTGLPQSKIRVQLRRSGGAFGGKAIKPAVYSALLSQVALNVRLPVRLVLPKEVDMRVCGGRQELEANWRAAVEPATGKVLALEYEAFLGHGATENMQKVLGHIMGAAVDQNYGIPSMKFTCHYIKQHVPPRTSTRSPGHYEASALAEAVMNGISSELNLAPHKVREANFFRKLEPINLKGGLLPQGKLDEYSHLVLWDMLKKKFNYEAEYHVVEKFNDANTYKKRGLGICGARYGVFVAPGFTCRIDIFKDGSVQVATAGTEMGQGLHTKVAQVVTTHFARKLGGACPPMDAISFATTSTDQLPNSPITGGSTGSEQSMYAALTAVDQLVERLKGSVRASKKRPAEKRNRHPTHGAWFDIIEECFSTKFLDVLVVPPNLSAVGIHMTPLTDIQYETFGVAAAEVEIDVLTGESRVLKTHIMFDIGKSFNPMVDMGQMEGAFIMGLGHILNEGMEYDSTTGRCLTDNTWTYKPPIACDIPEVFNADFVDLTHQRMENKCGQSTFGCVAGLLACLGVPWKPSKVERPYKSAKCIGEPPLLLAQCVHSAHASALVAGRGEKLPNHTLPIPAKPFVTLPMLANRKPGSSDALETASTGTPGSTSTIR